MEMKPNPQCSNAACLERQVAELNNFCNNLLLKSALSNFAIYLWNATEQKEYMLAKPARDAAAAAKAKMEAEESVEPEFLHDDNEWNIR